NMNVRKIPINGKFVVGVLVGLLFGFILGWYRARHDQMLAECKVHYANLRYQQVSPQLREYLKSRIYYLATSLDPVEMWGWRFDFGPVDTNALGNVTAHKEPMALSDAYQTAMQRHNQKGKIP